jgi:hypothetical protein
MKDNIQEKIHLNEQHNNGDSNNLKPLEAKHIAHNDTQEMILLRERYIELEKQHQKVNLDNQELKLQLDRISKQYESMKMRMIDVNNQLARGAHDMFFK